MAPFCEQTLFLIAFELVKVKSFKPGETILKMSKRSPLNETHKRFLEKQTNAIMNEVNEIRSEIDRFGYDRTVSTF